MAVHIATWEHTLLNKAHEGLHHPRSERNLQTTALMLAEAYDFCKNITKINSHTFYLASSLLPKSKRQAVQALYAFCRTTDDLVDKATPDQNIAQLLQLWRTRFTQNTNELDQVSIAWIHTQMSYGIPQGYVHHLIDGIGRDLTQNRYTTFAELTEYCYGVASTVGLMAMYIIGFQGHEALPYAIKLGVALQLTNILRDIGEDWQSGRLYVPQEDLEAFHLTEHDIALGEVTENWRAFMHFQINRTRVLYEESLPGIALLHKDGLFAIMAAAQLYQGILHEIEKNDYDVFHQRAHVPTLSKLQQLPRIWRQAHRQNTLTLPKRAHE